MSTNTPTPVVEVDEVEDSDYEADDFGFIIGADGHLKSVMFPENLMEDPPLEILLILKIFGINDIGDVEEKTLH
jgi:hypothetical protein